MRPEDDMQTYPSCLALAVRRWPLCFLLPAVIAAGAVAATFLLPRQYVATVLVTSVDVSGPTDAAVSLPKLSPDLYKSFFDNQPVMEGLIRELSLSEAPWHFRPETIRREALQIQVHQEAALGAGNAVSIAAEVPSEQLCREMVDYVVRRGLERYGETMEQMRKDLLAGFLTDAQAAEARYAEAVANREEFVKSSDFNEARKRLADQFDLRSWRDQQREHLRVEQAACRAQQQAVDGMLAQQQPTVELRKLLVDSPLLHGALGPAATSQPAALLEAGLTETVLNPAYYKAAAQKIETESRLSWLEGNLAALDRQAEADPSISALSDHVVGLEARLEALDFEAHQAKKAAQLARDRLSAFEQIPWPPRRLVALPATLVRKPMAAMRLTAGLAAGAVAVAVCWAAVCLRRRTAGAGGPGQKASRSDEP